MISRKIYVVGYGKGYASWLTGVLVNNMEEADLVLFTGGEDINPVLYDDVRHPTTHFSNRDKLEVPEFFKALKLGIPMLGICRGAQLGCALSGGKLIQDQSNPGRHLLYTCDGREFMINSLHHQAMYPFNLPQEEYKLLGWAHNHSKYHHNGRMEEMNPPFECEVVYFTRTRMLGIQCHPEMMDYYSNMDSKINATMAYFKELVDKYIPIPKTKKNQYYY